jgi:hypothetical protein
MRWLLKEFAEKDWTRFANGFWIEPLFEEYRTVCIPSWLPQQSKVQEETLWCVLDSVPRNFRLRHGSRTTTTQLLSPCTSMLIQKHSIPPAQSSTLTLRLTKNFKR